MAELAMLAAAVAVVRAAMGLVWSVPALVETAVEALGKRFMPQPGMVALEL